MSLEQAVPSERRGQQEVSEPPEPPERRVLLGPQVLLVLTDHQAQQEQRVWMGRTGRWGRRVRRGLPAPRERQDRQEPPPQFRQ